MRIDSFVTLLLGTLLVAGIAYQAHAMWVSSVGSLLKVIG